MKDHSNVIQIKRPVEPEITQKEFLKELCVQMFTDLLQQAEKGEILDAIVIVGTKEHMNCFFTPSEDALSQIGMAARLQFVLQSSLDIGHNFEGEVR